MRWRRSARPRRLRAAIRTEATLRAPPWAPSHLTGNSRIFRNRRVSANVIMLSSREPAGGPSMMKRSALLAAVISGILIFPFSAQAADPLPRAKPEDAGLSSERLALIGKTVNAEIA